MQSRLQSSAAVPRKQASPLVSSRTPGSKQNLLQSALGAQEANVGSL